MEEIIIIIIIITTIEILQDEEYNISCYYNYLFQN
jgi:hypothetical protein